MTRFILTYLLMVCSIISITVQAQDCSWERTGGYCNFDGDCCPGRQCSAF